MDKPIGCQMSRWARNGFQVMLGEMVPNPNPVSSMVSFAAKEHAALVPGVWISPTSGVPRKTPVLIPTHSNVPILANPCRKARAISPLVGNDHQRETRLHSPRKIPPWGNAGFRPIWSCGPSWKENINESILVLCLGVEWSQAIVLTNQRRSTIGFRKGRQLVFPEQH